jgi:hypothetical protein
MQVRSEPRARLSAEMVEALGNPALQERFA